MCTFKDGYKINYSVIQSRWLYFTCDSVSSV